MTKQNKDSLIKWGGKEPVDFEKVRYGKRGYGTLVNGKFVEMPAPTKPTDEKLSSFKVIDTEDDYIDVVRIK